MRRAECASRKNLQPITGAVFVLAAQLVDRPQENGLSYDELASGITVGEYGNGSAKGAGRIEYIYLPTEDGQAVPIGLYRSSNFYAVHADHINTPRLITDYTNKPVWQWPYSAFGNNNPTGILKATANPKAAITNQPVLLKATAPAFAMNQRYPGQYFDEESNLNYNYFRNYSAAMGRYSQGDPIGLDGGLNRFAYVDGNPLTFTDPMGLQAGAAGAAGGAAGGFGGLGGFGGAAGGSRGGYDPKTDRFNPGSTLLPMPSWLKNLVTPKSALDQCEADCEAEKEERDALCFIAQAMGGKAAQRECLSRSDRIAFQCRKDCKEKNCEP